MQSVVAERCERFAIHAISAVVVWNHREIISSRFDDYRNISLLGHAISRGVLFIISRPTAPSARRIQYPPPMRNPLHCVRMRNFRSVFELELRHDFYRSLINALILNIIHEELQYPYGILPIVSYHFVSKIHNSIHHLSASFYYYIFIRYNILLDNVK